MSLTTHKKKSYIALLEPMAFIVVLVFAAFFQFISLRSNPGWYSDEGYFIDFAAHLAQGEWQFMGLQNAPLFIQRPSLFLLVLTGVFKLLSADILVLRGLAAGFSLLSVALVFLFGRRILGAPLALLAAFLLAIQPTIVTFNRIGFTYNLLAPLLLITIWACWRFLNARNSRWIWLACISAGLGFSTDFLGIVGPILVGLLLLIVDRRRLLAGILLMAAIFSIMLLPYYLANPESFRVVLFRVIFSGRFRQAGWNKSSTSYLILASCFAARAGSRCL